MQVNTKVTIKESQLQPILIITRQESKNENYQTASKEVTREQPGSLENRAGEKKGRKLERMQDSNATKLKKSNNQ